MFYFGQNFTSQVVIFNYYKKVRPRRTQIIKFQKASAKFGLLDGTQTRLKHSPNGLKPDSPTQIVKVLKASSHCGCGKLAKLRRAAASRISSGAHTDSHPFELCLEVSARNMLRCARVSAVRSHALHDGKATWRSAGGAIWKTWSSQRNDDSVLRTCVRADVIMPSAPSQSR